MTETLSSAFAEVHKIVEGLGGKMTTPSKGRCKCPAHDDHDPSLDVEVKNGKPVWKCLCGNAVPRDARRKRC